MTRRRDNVSSFLLAAGFVSAGVAVAVAHANPATGYEYSIYTATPIEFWIGIVAALLLGGVVLVRSSSNSSAIWGTFLLGSAMVATVSLPVIRGYHYKGESDSLGHLGSSIDLLAGQINSFEMVYPAVHLLATILHVITGRGITYTLLLVVVLFITAFFIFVPLTVRLISPGTVAVLFAMLAAMFLLPVNHNSGGIFIHPASQAHMFTPAVLFSFLMYYKTRNWPTFSLWVLFFSAFILIHPQQAVNMLLVLGTVVVLQYGFNHHRGIEVTGHKLTYSFVAFAGLFWLWVHQLGRFESHFARRVGGLFRETEIGRPTASRSMSLEAVGGSLPEVFAKLFLVPLIFTIVTFIVGLTLVAILTGVHRSIPTLSDVFTDLEFRILSYITLSLFPLLAIFLWYFQHGTGSDQYFRHYAFMMVLMTIVGSIGITKFVIRWTAGYQRHTLVVLGLVLLCLTIPVVFPSPYFYQTSSHVTAATMDGYDIIYEYDDESVEYNRLRSNPSRYLTATRGTATDRNFAEWVPDHFADHEYRTELNETTYLPVTEADQIRDPVVWQGFRFDHNDFAYLERERGVNKIIDNGGVTLYQIKPEH